MSQGHVTLDQMTNTYATDEHLARVIQRMAGPTARPREDQQQAVRALVDLRSRVLVVQATGWGKSAVYWAAMAQDQHSLSLRSSR
jgi:ATP-dependent DNA helicase RecQ